jgi:threonine dehydratase
VSLEISRSDIEAAADRISAHVRLTPVLDLGNAVSPRWSLALKLENTQVTGSFKARGAFNVLLTNDTSAGVAAASGGNFGKAIGYASQVLDVPATIFVPETSPKEKIDPIAGFGCDVKLIPGYYDAALEASVAHAATTGAFLAHAFDQAGVVAGQGTVALEIDVQLPRATAVLVAVGGGGLIGGISSWFRGSRQVFAVEPEQCPTFHQALQEGRPVDVEVGGVAASSLGARRIGEHAWAARRWVDQSLLVGEESIVKAQKWLWDVARLWVEPAGATPIAALLEERVVPEDGESVVAVVSGGNALLG